MQDGGKRNAGACDGGINTDKTRFVLWAAYMLLVSWIWKELEIGFLGYSQPSLVDTFAASYIAWRLSDWCVEEERIEENQ